MFARRRGGCSNGTIFSSRFFSYFIRISPKPKLSSAAKKKKNCRRSRNERGGHEERTGYRKTQRKPKEAVGKSAESIMGNSCSPAAMVANKTRQLMIEAGASTHKEKKVGKERERNNHRKAALPYIVYRLTRTSPSRHTLTSLRGPAAIPSRGNSYVISPVNKYRIRDKSFRTARRGLGSKRTWSVSSHCLYARGLSRCAQLQTARVIK